MDENNIDLGQLSSRDIGNMISKQLVDLGKEEVKRESVDDIVDYGDLPSKALPEIGKRVVAEQLVKNAMMKE